VIFSQALVWRAKKSMKVGDQLDAIGEYCYRSWAMDANEARVENVLPVGLLHNASVVAPISKGDLITSNNVAPDQSTALYQLRQKQDQSLGY
jgi:predicted homoserine dehydrogenase-like protein